MKYYVYLLMDNYSRFILNYQVSTRVSAEIRLDSIRNAFRDYINSENVSLQKLIAGKDIHFSNSMVEAQNKLIKYYYLFKHPFQNLNELIRLLDWIIKDYNNCRPHHSLGGLTPFEALSGIKPSQEEWKKQINDARQARTRVNTSESCGIC